ncbi:hypothetical protein A2U01_0068821, partial [Trifolium medium]|nr:hypothetical protein [Trifolium medium]
MGTCLRDESGSFVAALSSQR